MLVRVKPFFRRGRSVKGYIRSNRNIVKAHLRKGIRYQSRRTVKGNLEIVAFKGREEVGYLRTKAGKLKGAAVLSNLHVHTSHRGKGIATGLYKSLRKKTSVHISDVVTSEAVPKIYKKLGAVKGVIKKRRF